MDKLFDDWKDLIKQATDNNKLRVMLSDLRDDLYNKSYPFVEERFIIEAKIIHITEILKERGLSTES